MNININQSIAHFLAIIECLSHEYIDAKTELIYASNYELLIAVILSAQTKDSQVNKVTKNLFKLANNPYDMVLLEEGGIQEVIKSIGLYKTKAKNIYNTSKMIIDEYNGKIPQSMEQLMGLPGVGRKTANVILNTCFDDVCIAVDTHVFRVANRTGIAIGNNIHQIEQILLYKIYIIFDLIYNELSKIISKSRSDIDVFTMQFIEKAQLSSGYISFKKYQQKSNIFEQNASISNLNRLIANLLDYHNNKTCHRPKNTNTFDKAKLVKILNNTHNYLVLHGRYICTSRKPKCELCCINKMCDFYLTKIPIN